MNDIEIVFYKIYRKFIRDHNLPCYSINESTFRSQKYFIFLTINASKR